MLQHDLLASQQICSFRARSTSPPRLSTWLSHSPLHSMLRPLEAVIWKISSQSNHIPIQLEFNPSIL
jgi:hypothetical protein